MSVLLTRKRVCAAKIEAVPGTAETLAGTDGAENFFNPTFEGDIPSFERQGQLSLSPLPSIPGARSAKFNVTTHIYNSGTATAPFWAAVLLPACGFVHGTGGVYTLQTGAVGTVTAGYYVHGNLYEVAGAQGNLKIMGDKVGEPLKMETDFIGLYVAPTATALLAPTFPTIKPPRFAGATLSLGAISLIVSKFELDMGNKVVLREDASNVAGYIGSVITDRQSKLTLTVEVPPIGTHDYYNDFLTSVESAFSLGVGTGSNNVVTIACPKLQLRSAPKLSDKDGIFTYELEFGLNRNASAGDDELTITLS